MFWLNVLRFSPYIRPNLVDLDALRRNVLDYFVLVISTNRANTRQEAEDSALRYSSQSDSGAHRATFDQCRDHRDFLRHADYVCHKPIVRQRFRISKRKATIGSILRRFLCFCPPRLSSLLSAFASLCVSHSLKSALAADPSSLRSHLSHDLLNDGKLCALSSFNENPASILDRIKFFSCAFPLWHTPQACHETGGTSRYAVFK
jgi:hypothetical protein